MSWIKRLFCVHEDSILKEFEIESEFDITKESGYVPTSYSSMTRQYITDYQCKHCGRIKRLTSKTHH